MRIIPRLLLHTGALLMLAPLSSGAQARTSIAPRDTILFVCEHGTVKSLLAKLEFERQAAAAGLFMTAVSRGSAADSVVPPWMHQALERDGDKLGSWKPQLLQRSDLKSATLVVSFDLPTSTVAGSAGPSQQWDGLPSVSQNYAGGRAAIRQRVSQLVDSLKAARHR